MLEQARNRCIYFLNLAHTADKNTFIVLKWLLVAHQIARGARHSRVAREMGEALGRIEQPKPGSSYELYLFQRLAKPYCHYLQKLCLLLSEPASERAAVEAWFMKYNLLRYALHEFCPVLGEFMPFFREHYPFLARIAAEVALDAERLMRELRSGYKTRELKYVERHELEGLEEQYGRLRESLPEQTVETLILTESEFCPGKVQNFFESASKVEGAVLFA